MASARRRVSWHAVESVLDIRNSYKCHAGEFKHETWGLFLYRSKAPNRSGDCACKRTSPRTVYSPPLVRAIGVAARATAGQRPRQRCDDLVMLYD
jgi:hypothetical protein